MAAPEDRRSGLEWLAEQVEDAMRPVRGRDVRMRARDSRLRRAAEPTWRKVLRGAGWLLLLGLGTVLLVFLLVVVGAAIGLASDERAVVDPGPNDAVGLFLVLGGSVILAAFICAFGRGRS